MHVSSSIVIISIIIKIFGICLARHIDRRILMVFRVHGNISGQFRTRKTTEIAEPFDGQADICERSSKLMYNILFIKYSVSKFRF